MVIEIELCLIDRNQGNRNQKSDNDRPGNSGRGFQRHDEYNCNCDHPVFHRSPYCDNVSCYY